MFFSLKRRDRKSSHNWTEGVRDSEIAFGIEEEDDWWKLAKGDPKFDSGVEKVA